MSGGCRREQGVGDKHSSTPGTIGVGGGIRASSESMNSGQDSHGGILAAIYSVESESIARPAVMGWGIGLVKMQLGRGDWATTGLHLGAGASVGYSGQRTSQKP